MGVPSYFSYIIKHYSNIIRKRLSLPSAVNHLFMDCNSIIYDSFYEMEKGGLFVNLSHSELETLLINRAIAKIKELIRYISPTKTVFIAFDGVAPFAKMDQQRQRRYKSAFMSTIDYGDKKASPKCTWNTAAITPGTQFMDNLSQAISDAFLNTEHIYMVDNMYVSCSDEPGEGEHKLFQYIRDHNLEKDVVTVYGLDSDLIMLSIFHIQYCANIFVFREAPEFLKSSITCEGDETPGSAEFYFMDIQTLCKSILSEMRCTYSHDSRIYDYVFMCFFLGNDFMPHIPSINIRNNGIQILMDTYRNVIGAYEERCFINNAREIEWKWVYAYIDELAKHEREHLIREHDIRDKWDKRYWSEKTPEDRQKLVDSCPVIYRASENYIAPKSEYWEERFYRQLFHLERTRDNVREICKKYMGMIEWVYVYYTKGCKDWRYRYGYDYGPLLKDISDMGISIVQSLDLVNNKETKCNEYAAMAQLCYVLPPSQYGLIDERLRKRLKHEETEFEYETGYCRYTWEGHIMTRKVEDWEMDEWDKIGREINE